ncbi:MAG: hypothetical protein KAT56_04590 [Sedimentisphaerales bacterium]|nr:hypothetical protein [Sedimentisphaerales bacterium]
MLKIAKKPGFQAGTMVEMRQKAVNQPQIRIFSIIVAENSFKMKSKRLTFRDKFGIMERRYSGAKKIRYTMLYGKSQLNQTW